MKKSLWQIGLLSALLALSACSKKAESDQSPESKDVPISAAPAEPVQALPMGEDAEQAMKEAATQNTEQAQLEAEADLEDVPEAIDFDEEAAKTATADAEVEDDAEK